jgi:hypothetical protein
VCFDIAVLEGIRQEGDSCRGVSFSQALSPCS